MISVSRVTAALLVWVAAACAGRGNNSSAHSPGEGDGGDAADVATNQRDAGAGTPSGAAPPYLLAAVDADGNVVGAGTLVVKVEWPDPKADLLRSPGLDDCGEPLAAPVSVHTLHGVRDTVVWLRDVTRGRAPNPPGTVELAVRDCRLRPRVAVAPRLGATLAVINDAERREEVVLELLGGKEPELLARIPMPLVGQRFEVVLDRPGIVRARRASGAAAPAYVHVPAHPYVALTNDKGTVEFHDVVPGSYRVVAWHAPLAEGGEPVTVTAEVTVTAAKKSHVTLSLAR